MALVATSNSSTATTHNIICKRGDTFERQFKFWSNAQKSDPVDISSEQFAAQVVGNAGEILSFTIGAGLSITDPNILVMSKDAESMLIPPGVYKYDLQQTTGDTVKTIIEGNFTIEPDITA